MLKSILITLATMLVMVRSSDGAELVHQFSSSAFNGQGYSSHVLTIKQLEDQAKDKNEAARDALKAEAERLAQNTPQARFVANLENRIYSQLAKQLTDSMFGEGASCTVAGVVCGTIPNLGGNAISWMLGSGSDQGMIVITIQDLANVGNITTMKVPAGTFYF